MALSFNIYEGTGAIYEFPITFKYIDKAHIYVSVNDTAVLFEVDTINSVVRLTDVPLAGARIKVYRKTPRDRTYSDFSRGNSFGQRNVNNSFLWLLYISQEISEGTWGDEFEIGRNLDMRDYRIVNLGDPIDDKDAVPKHVVDALDKRVEEFEQSISSDGRFINWRYNATGGETQVKPPYVFTNARVHIEGVRQRAGTEEGVSVGQSYFVKDNTIFFTTPLNEGEWVDVELGIEPTSLDDCEALVEQLKNVRKDSASQLGLVYLDDWSQGMVIPDGAMTAKLAVWNDGKFYSIGTDTGFVSADFEADLDKGWFVSASLTTQIQQWRDTGDVRGWGVIGDGIADDSDAFQLAHQECAMKGLDVNISYLKLRITKTIYTQQATVGAGCSRGNVKETWTSQIILDNEVGFTAFKPKTFVAGVNTHNLAGFKGVQFYPKQYRKHVVISGNAYETVFEDVVCWTMKRFFLGSGVSAKFKNCYMQYNEVAFYLLNFDQPSTMWQFEHTTCHSNDVGILFSNYKFTDDTYTTTEPSGHNFHRNITLTNTVLERNRLGLITPPEVQLWDFTLYNCWTEQNTEFGIKTRGSESRIKSINTRLEIDKWDVDINSVSGGVSKFENTRNYSQFEHRYLRSKDFQLMTQIELLFKWDRGTNSYNWHSRSFESEDDALENFALLTVDTDTNIYKLALNQNPVGSGEAYQIQWGWVDVGFICSKENAPTRAQPWYENRFAPDATDGIEAQGKWTDVYFKPSSLYVKPDGTVEQTNITPEWVSFVIYADARQPVKTAQVSGGICGD